MYYVYDFIAVCVFVRMQRSRSGRHVDESESELHGAAAADAADAASDDYANDDDDEDNDDIYFIIKQSSSSNSGKAGDFKGNFRTAQATGSGGTKSPEAEAHCRLL